MVRQGHNRRKTSNLLLLAAEGQKVADMTITSLRNCVQMRIWKRTINMADDDLDAKDLGWENHLDDMKKIKCG